jgi:membrane-associated protease RseP (regulator of RpoE activity)
MMIFEGDRWVSLDEKIEAGFRERRQAIYRDILFAMLACLLFFGGITWACVAAFTGNCDFVNMSALHILISSALVLFRGRADR